ncbi:hypothetical protein K1719_005253 [Acacia pycnantha]|nr:hypothetical protein K1719_005253 [Acacia pycnantha]
MNFLVLISLNKMRKGRGGSDDELEEEDDKEVFLSTRIRLASCCRQRPSRGIGFRVGGRKRKKHWHRQLRKKTKNTCNGSVTQGFWLWSFSFQRKINHANKR